MEFFNKTFTIRAIGERHDQRIDAMDHDSTRTQMVMELLLQRIVKTGSEIVIIDITGVPTVDTLVAQHLPKPSQRFSR